MTIPSPLNRYEDKCIKEGAQEAVCWSWNLGHAAPTPTLHLRSSVRGRLIIIGSNLMETGYNRPMSVGGAVFRRAQLFIIGWRRPAQRTGACANFAKSAIDCESLELVRRLTFSDIYSKRITCKQQNGNESSTSS